ncbi:MAG TPA: ABC transporter ATP-binding protein [Steroidobacteraceae bacterium]|nr:ABC transporter ATP-binding protein [Steroidobacteraceae bacterium]
MSTGSQIAMGAQAPVAAGSGSAAMAGQAAAAEPRIPVIALSGVEKVYRTGEVEVKAVTGVTLTVQRGDFLAIMGASGSGKSTMMNILGCLDRPTAGEYRLDGVSVAGLKRAQLARLRNHKLGFVFQSFNLLPRTTALENVELPLFYSEPLVPLREQRRRAREALERVGLGSRLSHRPSQLSGGQQQRIAIARALVNHPDLLLADEPTGNLDSRTSIDIMGLFQELNDSGITVIVVTHELDVAAYCRRIVVMRDGRVLDDRPNAAPARAAAQRARLDREEQAANIEERGGAH